MSRNAWRLQVTRKNPWRLLLTRCLSSRQGEEKLRAVPFTRSIEEAKAAYEEHHGGIISWVPSRSPRIEEKFLPFWAVACRVHVRITAATLGFLQTRWAYNFRTKRVQPRREVFYKNFTWPFEQGPSWISTHEPSSDLCMQICASFHYPWSHLNGIRSFDTFRGAKHLTADMVDDSHQLGRVRGLEEFIMRPASALASAKATISHHAREKAKAILLRTHAAHSVFSVELSMDYLAISLSPIYVPVFIFESSYLGETHRTFLHGSTLVTEGQKLYNAPAAAFAGGVLSAVALTVLEQGGFPPLAAVLFPAMAFGLAAFIYPLIALKLQNWFQAREQRRHFLGGPDSWDEEYITAFSTHQQWRRQPQPGRTGGSRDPKGLYAMLGIPVDASANEIKSAFRSQALKHHPDRFLDPKEKEAAKIKFQKILAAYEVLRDKNKRKLYDKTGKAG